MTYLTPYLITLAAITCYASLSPMVKKVGETLPPFTVIATSSLIHFVIAGAIAFFLEKEQVINNADKIHWKLLLAFSITNLIGYSLYLLALTKVPVAHYQMFGLLTPIIGGLLAWFLLKEPFHARYLLSLIFISIGLIIAIKPEIFKRW